MKVKLSIILMFFLAYFVLDTPNSYCQVKLKEEKEEDARAINLMSTLPPQYKFSSRVAVFGGYDTNVNLSPDKEGDVYEEFLYSFDFRRKSESKLDLFFSYDLDYLNYNKVTDASNLLNHFRLGMDKEVSHFNIGTGYDLGIFYYPNNDDEDFLFHKLFAYIKHRFSKNFQQRLQFEAGLKNYIDRKAMADTMNTYQDDTRSDNRLSLEYSLSSDVFKKLFLMFRAKASVNNSNVSYQDFYDYAAYEGALYMDYQLLRKLYFTSNLSYMKKIFDNRMVTLRDYRERDNLYTATAGFSYRINNQNDVSVFYTYRRNTSNDDIAEYCENVMNLSVRHYF